MIQIVEIRRKHQKGFKKGDGTDPEKVIGGNRGYDKQSDRNRAIKQLHRRSGFNHFVCYRDTKSPVALQYGTADWVQPGSIYVNR